MLPLLSIVATFAEVAVLRWENVFLISKGDVWELLTRRPRLQRGLLLLFCVKDFFTPWRFYVCKTFPQPRNRSSCVWHHPKVKYNGPVGLFLGGAKQRNTTAHLNWAAEAKRGIKKRRSGYHVTESFFGARLWWRLYWSRWEIDVEVH